MNWIYDGGFIAHKLNDDGSKTVKQFTSSAQARQFVEQATGRTLVKRHRKHKPAVPRRRPNSTVISASQLTADQKLQKAEAMKQLAGLKPVAAK